MRLHSIHDREGSIEVPEGGFALDLVALSENPSPVDYQSLKPSVNWLIRLGWGYGGSGTVPIGDLAEEFITRAHTYLLNSSGYHAAIVGNEPNHEAERPGGAYINPKYIAWIYTTLRNRVKTSNPSIRLITPAIAPYHANPIDWRDYLHSMLLEIPTADGIAIHAYSRSMEPSEASSEAKMNPPLETSYRSFRTYLDALAEVPPTHRSLPAYLTEFNPIPDWENRNSGIVKAVYREIKAHNGKANVQKIVCLTLFRWNNFQGQRWGIEDKPEVIADFREAVAESDPALEDRVYIPRVSNGTETAEYPLYFDPEAQARGVDLVEAIPSEKDSEVWKAVEINYLDEKESQGRHHFYFDTLDETGNRLTGVEILVWWPDGMHKVYSEAKPGEPYSANFPMSPGKNAFSAKISTGIPSDVVTGVGMGADTDSGFNAGIHTSTFVKWQKFTIREPVVEQAKAKINLIHPLENPAHRRITQNFGENPKDYARFNLLGHTGIDFAAPEGSVVRAVDNGVVVENAVDPEGYGQYLKIKHSWGESLYAHLSKTSVSVAESVQKGQRIALSGNTGNSTGPHLHYAMRVNPYKRNDGWGGFTNPASFLRTEEQPVPSHPSFGEVLSAIKQAAEENGLDWRLFASQAWAESSFNPNEENGGLFQISSPVWEEIAPQVGALDISNPLDNARVAAYYLKGLLNYYKGNPYKAVLAYSFGAGRVDAGEEPPVLTKTYLDKVMHGRDLLNALESS